VLLVLAGLVVGLVLVVLLVGWSLAITPYAGPRSDHFDGKHFDNRRATAHAGGWAFIKWRLTRKPGPWRERALQPGAPPPERVDGGQLRVTFVNHATVLVQMDGVNLLTDPIWSDRASPFSWIGPRRFHPPGIRFEDLPPISVVVISHNHYDHLDLPTLRRLAATHRPRFFVGLGNGRLLEEQGIQNVTELDWWKSVSVATQVDLVGLPAQHFSTRGLGDRDRTLWLGFGLRGPSGRVYFGGDTGAGPHFEEIRRGFGSPRLSVLPIGAYQPRWFMSGVHVEPAEAVAAHQTLGASTSVGMHFGTFRLADEGQDEAIADLRTALSRLPPPAPRFWVLEPGEGRDVP
jgi:L-ascorbate metabolism protein UlaG (beta-lactamase superfamily)